MVQEQIKKRSLFDRFISGVEFVGNKLPHPFWIFVILIGVLAVISWILSLAEVSVTYTAAARSAGDAPKEVTETVKNLMSLDVLKDYLVNFTKNYSGFWPMGLVMSMMVAIGVAEHSGLIMALMRRAILGAPMVMITAIIAIVGINSNLASDAGVVFTPAIAAAMFKALGLNPWVGIITGYAAANGGFTANFFIAGTDALLSGITGSVTSAAHIDAPVHPLMNWYFMMAATVVITIATVIVTKYFLIPHLGGNKGELDREEISKHTLTEDEMRGLRWSRNTTIAFFLLLIVAVIPESSFLRNPDGTLLPRSPLIGSIVGLLFFFFVFVGISYGYGAKTIRSSADIPAMMQKGLASALSFLVVALSRSDFHLSFQREQTRHGARRQGRGCSYGSGSDRHSSVHPLYSHRGIRQSLHHGRLGQVAHHGTHIRPHAGNDGLLPRNDAGHVQNRRQLHQHHLPHRLLRSRDHRTSGSLQDRSRPKGGHRHPDLPLLPVQPCLYYRTLRSAHAVVHAAASPRPWRLHVHVTMKTKNGTACMSRYVRAEESSAFERGKSLGRSTSMQIRTILEY